MRLVLFLSAFCVVAGATVACGAPDEAPLGGPYGGAGTFEGPTPGQAASPTAPASSSGAPGSSGGGSGGTSRPSSCPSATSGTGAGADAGAGPTADAGSAAAPPKWSELYAAYFAKEAVGTCGTCHGQMSSAASSYAWLKAKGQIPGIADPSVSRLSWLCGDMPPKGPTSNAKAVADLAAWAAAGARGD